MKAIFDDGMLVGEDMLQCSILVQRASVVFPDNQVLAFLFTWISLHRLMYSPYISLIAELSLRHAPNPSWYLEHCPRNCSFALGLRSGSPCFAKNRPFKMGRQQILQEFFSPWWGGQRFSGHSEFLYNLLSSLLIAPDVYSYPTSLLAQPSPLAEALDVGCEERRTCFFLLVPRPSCH